MGVESDADLLLFLSANDFGSDVVLNGNEPVRGVFFNGSEETQLAFDGPQIINNRPQVVCRTSDVTLTGLNTTTQNGVVIGGVSYTAREILPDGTGLTVIELHEVT